MYTATVYSTPGCVQCTATYRALDRDGIPYVVVDLADEANAETRRWITDELGHSQAPVVVVDQDPANHWSGYRPDRLAQLASTTA